MPKIKMDKFDLLLATFVGVMLAKGFAPDRDAAVARIASLMEVTKRSLDVEMIDG